MTFEQFTERKCLLPWILHCIIWGIDTEHEDANRKVWSYPNGLYIEDLQNGTFTAEYGRTSSSGDDLPNLEKIFWEEFAKYEINPDHT